MLATQATHLTPTQRARRKRILQATSDIVAVKGYEGMIMRDVAHRAEVSPTTLYNLYNTKDDLLLAALQQKIVVAWSKAAALEPELGFSRIMLQNELSVAETTEQPEFARAITRVLYRARQGDQITQVLISESERALEESLQMMSVSGQLNCPDMRWLSRNLVRSFWGHYFAWSSDLLQLDHLAAEIERSYLLHFLPFAQGNLAQQLRSRLLELTRLAYEIA